jgi:tetratricopeptide (TPR) repeat protein
VIGVFGVVGLAGQAAGLVSLRRAHAARAASNFSAMHVEYKKGAQVARLFAPFTLALDSYRARARRDGDAIFRDADLSMEQSDWLGAEASYRGILLFDPNNLQARANLGTALLRQGKHWESSQCYLGVLRHDPNDLVALYHLALARIQLGETASAVELVERILSIDTDGNAFELIKGENVPFIVESPDGGSLL